MVNIERVKHECQISFYEQNEAKQNRKVGCYYRSDFIGREIIKSIFTGTFAYLGMVVLWGLGNLDALLDSLNDLSIINTMMAVGLVYIGYLLVYLFLTYLVYAYRYQKGRKKMNRYKEHLKALHRMYEREEKLML